MAMLVKTMYKLKETKGTVVYENKDDDAPVSVVYVKKSFLGEVIPVTILLTVDIS